MCGIFGVFGPDIPVQRFLTLGAFAMTRGSDSAGIARIRSSMNRPVGRRDPADLRRATVDRVRFDRGRTDFMTLVTSRPAAFDRMLSGSIAAYGHTRHATISSDELAVADTSPMPVTGLRHHSVVGVHNGGLDPLPGYDDHTFNGSTSSERLFAALADAGNDAGQIRATLTRARGRIAAIWASTTDPERIWVARGARSPLAVATDQRDRTWVASSPDWLYRLHDDGNGIRPSTVRLLPEGTLLGIDPTTGQIAHDSTFDAYLRPRDAMASRRLIYAGLSTQDVHDSMRTETATVDWSLPMTANRPITVDDLFPASTPETTPADA